MVQGVTRSPAAQLVHPWARWGGQGLGYPQTSRDHAHGHGLSARDASLHLGVRPALWDGRWHVSGPQVRGISVRALGKAGLAQLPVPRDRSIPEASLLAQPALWQGDRLVGAPLAGWANGWSAELARGEEDFFTSLITH